MPLPDFIKRMLDFMAVMIGFKEKVEKNLTAEEALKNAQQDLTGAKTKLTDAEAKAKQLEADLATTKQTIQTLQGQITAKDNEIATLKGEAKSAGARAADIAASQGIPAEQAAAIGGTDAGKVATGADIEKQLAAITDPTKRTEFFRANAAAIKAAGRAQREAARKPQI